VRYDRPLSSCLMLLALQIYSEAASRVSLALTNISSAAVTRVVQRTASVRENSVTMDPPHTDLQLYAFKQT